MDSANCKNSVRINNHLDSEVEQLKYLPSIQKPGALDKVLDREVFTELVNAHLEDLSNKKGDWNNSIYDQIYAWKAGLLNVTDLEMMEHIVSIQNENGTWGNQSFPQSAIIDTLMVVQAIAEKKLEIPGINKIASGLNLLIDKCLDYKGQDFVAFELIFSQQIKYLLHKPETHSIIKDFLGQLFSGQINVQNAEGDENKAAAKMRKMERIFYVGEKIGKGAWKLNLSRTSGLLFDPTKTFSFAMEAIYYLDDLRQEEIDAVMKMVNKNGSIGFSPAATIGVIETVRKFYDNKNLPIPDDYKIQIENMIGYINQTGHDYRKEEEHLSISNNIPNLHPIDTSGDLWNLLTLFLSGAWEDLKDNDDFKQSLVDIYTKIERTPNGVAWGRGHTLYDLDDTVTTFELQQILSIMGITIPGDEYSVDAINNFLEISGRFICYPYEGDPSFGAVAHLLSALETALKNPNLDPESRDKVLSMLNKATALFSEHFIKGYGYSTEEIIYDKWHASKFYAIRSILSTESLFLAIPKNIDEIVDIVIENQNLDGGFGELENSTLEETSYVISALYTFLNNSSKFESDLKDDPRFEKLFGKKERIYECLEKAKKYFTDTLEQEGIVINELWISKNLYSAKFQTILAIINSKYIIDSKIDIDSKQLIGDPQMPTINQELIKPSNFMKAIGTVMQKTRALTGKKAKYFTDGEKFSSLWATMLDIINGAYRITNSLMIGLDALAESTPSVPELQRFMRELEDLVDLDSAKNFITQSQNASLDSLEESLKYTLANMIIEACELEKLKNDNNLRQHYLGYVKKQLQLHNESQIREAMVINNGEIIIQESINENSIEDLMKEFSRQFGDSIGVSPIIAMCLPFSTEFDINMMVTLNKTVDIYNEMMGIANQLLVTPEEFNMGLFLTSIISNSKIDDNLKKKLFGPYFEEIKLQSKNPLHKTPEMMELQLKMQTIFSEKLFPEYLEKIEDILRNDSTSLTREQRTMLDRFHSSLVNITNKLSIDDIQMVFNFLGIPANQMMQFLR